MFFIRELLLCLLLQSSIQNCLTTNDLQQRQQQQQQLQVSKQATPERVIDGVSLEVVEDNDHLVRCLEKILQPRVVGTPGHTNVQNFIVRELENLGFVTELEHFTAVVPKFQNLTFANIIGIHNPYAIEYIALACHYDSKYFPNDPNFVGAIDSAVPCAILLNVAKTLQNILINDFKNHQDLGLMLVFFDGEEAFENWSDIDSLYGSRHLANKLMSSTTHPTFRRDIDRLKVLILLDLIGSANPRFYSFNRNTHNLHTHLWHIERKLMQSNLLETRNFMFSKRQTSSYVDDDHRPFQQQSTLKIFKNNSYFIGGYDQVSDIITDVPILHLIPTPFPRVWHTSDDNATNLHWPTIRSFNKIFQQFVYDLLRKHPRDLNFRS